MNHHLHCTAAVVYATPRGRQPASVHTVIPVALAGLTGIADMAARADAALKPLILHAAPDDASSARYQLALRLEAP